MGAHLGELDRRRRDRTSAPTFKFHTRTRNPVGIKLLPDTVTGHDDLNLRLRRLRTATTRQIFQRRVRFTPLVTRLSSRHGQTTKSSSSVAKVTCVSSPPINLYISNNFAVTLCQSFKFINLVHNQQTAGVLCTELETFKPVHCMTLSPSGHKILIEPNAGGSSVVSEVLSFEMLHKCFGAKLLKTEMEVEYWPEGGSITDYTCSLFGKTLGVSVTRAMKYGSDPYTTFDAERLLMKKLRGVVQSSENSLEKWSKQILHVWATSTHVAAIVEETYASVVPAQLKSNTVILITVADDTEAIFNNKT